MRKLTLSILAASIALFPASALAEQHRGGGGGHGGGGHGGGGHGGGGHGGGGSHRGGGFVGGGFFGGGFWGGGGGGGQTVVVIGGDGQVMHPGGNWQRRLRRGGFVHPYWYGSQFYIDDWRGYGFADPGPDRRWIRYYDDAYLIDRGGRVVDGREDFDWRRHRDDWDDDDGVPMHRRHRGNHGEDGYSWFEHGDHDGRGDHDGNRGHDGHAGGWDMSGYGHGGTAVYGGYGGYGYYAYPIVIETTTTYGQTYSEEVVEEYVQVRRPHRRVRPCQCARPRAPAPRPRAPVPRPRPRPPAGERG